MNRQNFPDKLAIAAEQNIKEREYWLNKLSGTRVKTDFLGINKTIPVSKNTDVGETESDLFKFKLNRELFSKLMEQSGGSDYKLHIILMAGLVLLHNKYTGSRDIIVNTPVYKPDIEGDFINTVLPLRIYPDPHMTFRELLKGLSRTLLEAEENQNYPIEILLDRMDIPGSEGGASIFDFAVVVENIHDRMHIRHMNPGLLFSFSRTDESVEGELCCSTGKYNDVPVQRAIRHFEHLLTKSLFDIDTRLSTLEMVTGDEKNRLLYDFNNTQEKYPGDKPLHELFEARVEKTPHNIAVVERDGKGFIHYLELNEKSSRLAGRLRDKGVKTGDIVGIKVDSPLHMIMGIMAVLKAGAAYLPLASQFTGEEDRKIFEESPVRVILTQRHLAGALSEDNIFIDDSAIYMGEKPNLAPGTGPGETAGVLFTSGTTGKPKVVKVAHRNITNLVYGIDEKIYMNEQGGLNICLTFPFEFASSLMQLFGALLLGHTLYPLPGGTGNDGAGLLEFYGRNKIDISDGTPAHLNMLVNSLVEREAGGDPGIILPVKHFIIGGERLPKKTIKEFRAVFEKSGRNIPRITFIYGTAEGSAVSTFHELSREDVVGPGSIPIGRPMPNHRIYILDGENHLLPPGMIGEIHIAGTGVTEPYRKDDSDADKKFVEDPFFPGERMVKTGDLGQWSADGNLEFFERTEFQLDIGGIKTGATQIEQYLLEFPGVKEVVVVKGENGQLCAYIVPGSESDPPGLEKHLGVVYPGCAIPAAVVYLDKMPLTSGGKIHRNALMEGQLPGKSTDAGYRNDIEEKLVDIWAEILEIAGDSFTIDDSFFDLGGQSLKGIMMSAQIHKEFNVSIPIPVIFELASIRRLAQYLENEIGDKYSAVEPVEEKEYYALSPAQKRLFVLQQMNVESNSYNIVQAIKLESPDREKLHRVFHRLLDRHESLRTYFEVVEDEPVQKILPLHDIRFQVEYLETETGNQEEIIKSIKDFSRAFDLGKAPLISSGVIEDEKKNHYLLIVLHHIISDAASRGILVKDFTRLWRGEELPALKLRYKDYSGWLKKETHKETMKNHESYWLEQLGGELPLLNLPIDFERPPVYSAEGSWIFFALSKKVTRGLRGIARDEDATIFMVLLALTNVFLSKISSQEDIVIGTPVAGRRHVDLEQIVGMFVNTLAIRTYPLTEKTFREFLKEVKARTLEAFENQEYPFENLVKKMLTGRDVSRNPLFDVMFTMHDIKGRLGDIVPAFNLKEAETDEQKNLISQYDMTIAATELEDRLLCNFEYCTRLFKKETMERFAGYFKKVVSWAAADPDAAIGDLEIITGEEKTKVLYDFNKTRVEYPLHKTIHELFEEQAAKTPGNTAVSTIADLSDIYEELKSEEMNTGLFKRIEECCFKKKTYLFSYDLDLPGKKGSFKIVKTDRHNCVVINGNMWRLLHLFDGKRSARSIFSQIKHLEAGFLLYCVTIEEDLEIYSDFRSKTGVIPDNKFENFVVILKSLYSNNLIDLAAVSGSMTTDTGTGTDVGEIGPLEAGMQSPHMDDILKESHPLGQVDVLLLGDTIGMPGTGLLYLASYLRRSGIKACCRFYDADRDHISLKRGIEELLAAVRPKIAAISMKWFLHIARVREICRIVKEYSPDITVVVGGNTASYYPREIIQFDPIDYVIKGDGEVPLLELCRGAEYIQNCLYKKNGEIIENPITYVQDRDNPEEIYLSHLDEILISHHTPVVGMFFIYTHKGCCWNCLYCGGAHKAVRKKFNRSKLFRRKPEHVRKDIMAAKKYTSAFLFDFDAPNKDLLEYCKQIWEGIDLLSHSCVYTNLVPPSPELIKYVNDTFKYVYWNLDLASMSQGHRDRLFAAGKIKPQPSDSDIIAFFEECENYDNAEIRLNLISGLPYFTVEDIKASEGMLSYLMDRYSCFSELHWGRLHAQPGASAAEEAEQYDMYSHASTFPDFLKYSEKNFLENSQYPAFQDYDYPYIYYNDDELNSKLSKHYMETNLRVEEFIDNKRKRSIIRENFTYRELDKRANQLANLLRVKQVKPDTIVAVMAERSLEMIAAVFGVLKAGGAYLPIDPDYPLDRKMYMLKDSRACFLVTDDMPLNGIGEVFDGEIIRLNSPDILRQKCTKPAPVNTSANLAYIIYTSGSTGKSKGMLIEHRNVVNYMLSSLDLLQLTPGDTRTQQSSFSFDQFVEETYSILIAGGRLLLINKYDVRDIERFKEIIHQNKVTVLTTTPPLLNELNKYPLAPGVRKVLVGGDELKKEHVSHIVQHVPVDNFYGPTETTASATHYRYTGDVRSPIPIGKPRVNYQVYILDRQYHIVPPGVPGEICISGEGVGRGYLNRPELTREKFVENPLLEAVPMYKSGDLGRWLPDGNIEFSGRIDKQVKIRGYRIETGEIENQLRRILGIQEAVVTVCTGTPDESIQDENKFLCAYIVSDEETNTTELRKQLTGQLPDYMIPSYFMRIDHFPVTSNGKIDKKGLPHPKVKPAPAAAAPRSELEEKLTTIWSEVLEMEKKTIGIDVDFFELGGHSLKATKMVSKMHKELNVKVPLNEVFRNPTIKGIAAYVKKTAEEKYAAIVPQPPREYYELSSAQSRLYFLHQLNPETVSYNMPQFAILKGNLERKRLEETSLRLIQRHESLRTSFEMVNGKPMQRIHRHAAFQLQYFDLHAGNLPADEKNIIMDFAKPFRLSCPPLMRAGLIKTKPDEHIWMIDIHHIISDGVSMEVLIKDFMALYEGRPLKKLKIHYKDFAEWQNRLFRSDFLEKQKAYWLNIFKDRVPALNLPVDFGRPSIRNFKGSYASLELEESLGRGIHILAQQTECTLYMILLAVYNVLLAKYTGKEDITVGSPVTGRTHADLETVIGMFVNMLAMRNHPYKNKPFIELLAEVKKNAINAYENQDYPFPELVKQLGIKREPGKNPLFDTVFQLNHGETGPINIGNLQLLPYDSKTTISQFDLIMGVTENTREISLRLFYPSDLFKPSTVEKMLKRYVEILEQVTFNKEIKLRDINISSDLLVSSSAAPQDADSDFCF